MKNDFISRNLQLNQYSM